jgi:Uma2 family endonuclease
MATRATSSTILLNIEEFLDIDFKDHKVELDNGIVRMMAGGTAAHARVQANVLVALHTKLRGSGCAPYGSDMGVRAHDLSLRYPDVSVFCGRDTPENDKLRVLDDPRVIVEVLSPSTREHDVVVKLPEYRAIPSVETIIYVDPDDESIQVIQRTAAAVWTDAMLDPDEDVVLPQFGTTLTRAEIFARA